MAYGDDDTLYFDSSISFVCVCVMFLQVLSARLFGYLAPSIKHITPINQFSKAVAIAAQLYVGVEIVVVVVVVHKWNETKKGNQI